VYFEMLTTDIARAAIVRRHDELSAAVGNYTAPIPTVSYA